MREGRPAVHREDVVRADLIGLAFVALAAIYLLGLVLWMAR